jgi:hypothetical protein
MEISIRQFVKELRNVVNQQVVSNSVQIGKGTCKDMEEYKRKVGFNEGLDAAASLAESMYRQLEDRDKDSDLPPMPPAPGDQQ